MVNNRQIGAIIQARMKSTRLPGKVLMPLSPDDSKPLLAYIMDTLNSCEGVDHTVIATTTAIENDILQKVAEENEWKIFRGSENDVLSRFVNVIHIFKLDAIIRLTADNPFLDRGSLEKLIQLHINHGNDYTYSSGLPLGMNIEIVDASTLVRIASDKRITDQDREHVTYFISRHDEFKKEIIHLPTPPHLQNLRLTVDYPSDWALAALLASTINPQKNLIAALNEKIKKHPWLKDINNNNFQKEYLSETDELRIAIHQLELMELHYAAALLKGYIK